jgi:N-acetylmuramate 1-kinase
MLTRKNALNNWLKKIFPHADYKITKLAGDASHRSYYRLTTLNDTKIIMDSPPNKLSLNPFIEISKILSTEDFSTPTIHAHDLENGFLLLDDFGDKLFLQSVASTDTDILYKEALSVLAKMQTCSNNGHGLPVFDKEYMQQELALFKEWFIEKYLGITLDKNELEIVSNTFNWLTSEISSQPKSFVHKDYHSRNIMIINSENQSTAKLGIIDYQDAMHGPFTYDLVSLLKDCYIQWPHQQILDWLTFFYNEIKVPHSYSKNDFIKAFDLCGLQRHIRVLGIFSRLYLRDNKPNYLQDLPLTLNYVMSCLECYDELEPFQELMLKKIQPLFLSKLQ